MKVRESTFGIGIRECAPIVWVLLDKFFPRKSISWCLRETTVWLSNLIFRGNKSVLNMQQWTSLLPCKKWNQVTVGVLGRTGGVWGAEAASHPDPIWPKWELCQFTLHKVKHISVSTWLLHITCWWYSWMWSQGQDLKLGWGKCLVLES